MGVGSEVSEVSEHSQRARAMKKADAITYLSKLLEDEQKKSNDLYCRYHTLYDLCYDIAVFGWSPERAGEMVELVREENL